MDFIERNLRRITTNLAEKTQKMSKAELLQRKARYSRRRTLLENKRA